MSSPDPFRYLSPVVRKPPERHVLAFDPGPKTCGWASAWVERPMMTRPHFRAAGIVASDARAIRDLIDTMRGFDVTIAVELPGRYLHDARRASAVIDTSGIARLIEGVCLGCDVPCTLVTVQSWRRSLCRGTRGTPGDAAVKTTLGLLCTGLPKRTNVHMRDALGLACVVLLGTPIIPGPTPPIPMPWRPARRRRSR